MSNTQEQTIERHRTAISRNKLSAPVQTLLNYGFLDGDYSFFDYGCGRGDDLKSLRDNEINASGWDPVHSPDSEKTNADIVNLGFVLNVIEDPDERLQTLIKAYELSDRLLVVSVMTGNEQKQARFDEFGDGVITQRNTFQKYFTQPEIRHYIDTALDNQSITVAPGVLYIFKNKIDEQLFLLARLQTRRLWQSLDRAITRKTLNKDVKQLIDQNKDLIDNYWNCCLTYGRQPTSNEFYNSPKLKAVFGGNKKAYDFVSNLYDINELQNAKESRISDLLVYFALRLFEKRKAYSSLAPSIKKDVSTFFKSFKSANTLATNLLYSCGNVDYIHEACEYANQELKIGYLDGEHSLTLHTSQLNELPPILRVYAGCASILYGDLNNVDLIKLHIKSGKVSLMIYDDFENNPLPILKERIKIKLREQDIDYFIYNEYVENQLIYFKSKYISQDFVNYKKQQSFDNILKETLLINIERFGPTKKEFDKILLSKRLKVRDFSLLPM